MCVYFLLCRSRELGTRSDRHDNKMKNDIWKYINKNANTDHENYTDYHNIYIDNKMLQRNARSLLPTASYTWSSLMQIFQSNIHVYLTAWEKVMLSSRDIRRLCTRKKPYWHIICSKIKIWKRWKCHSDARSLCEVSSYRKWNQSGKTIFHKQNHFHFHCKSNQVGLKYANLDMPMVSFDFILYSFPVREERLDTTRCLKQ